MVRCAGRARKVSQGAGLAWGGVAGCYTGVGFAVSESQPWR